MGGFILNLDCKIGSLLQNKAAVLPRLFVLQWELSSQLSRAERRSCPETENAQGQKYLGDNDKDLWGYWGANPVTFCQILPSTIHFTDPKEYQYSMCK